MPKRKGETPPLRDLVETTVRNILRHPDDRVLGAIRGLIHEHLDKISDLHTVKLRMRIRQTVREELALLSTRAQLLDSMEKHGVEIVKDTPPGFRPVRPAVMCGHANEVPKVCRCDSDCACRQLDATCTSPDVIRWRRA